MLLRLKCTISCHPHPTSFLFLIALHYLPSSPLTVIQLFFSSFSLPLFFISLSPLLFQLTAIPYPPLFFLPHYLLSPLLPFYHPILFSPPSSLPPLSSPLSPPPSFLFSISLFNSFIMTSHICSTNSIPQGISLTGGREEWKLCCFYWHYLLHSQEVRNGVG